MAGLIGATDVAMTKRQASSTVQGSSAGSALIGQLLRGSWRRFPAVASMSETELATVTPLLLGSGGAALAWRRIAGSVVATSPSGVALKLAARRQAIDSLKSDLALAQIATRLNAVGVTPLLFKGWSIAQCYPEPHLRPYSDFDLLVRPSDWSAACDAMKRDCVPDRSNPAAGQFSLRCDAPLSAQWIDMHASLPAYYATSALELFERARRLTLPYGQTLLEPCPEDHLRIVILHFLKHGGWRPLWLCDIALLVETAGPDFDWNLCLTTDPSARAWIGSAIVLAADLLGCNLAGVPDDINRQIPAWLISTILTEWRAPYAYRYRSPKPAANVRYVLAKFASYWPNPISSSILRHRGVSLGRPIYYQIEYCTAEISRAVLKALRRGLGLGTRSRPE